MKPLNYAILKYFTTVKEASAEDVIEALKGEYGKFKALNKKDVIGALMTAEANCLLEETRFDLNDKGELRVYYRANEDGAATINKYIKDK
jgi:DNA-binding PadR family transcriptional regulator